VGGRKTLSSPARGEVTGLMKRTAGPGHLYQITSQLKRRRV
jgi:hypothetical protein